MCSSVDSPLSYLSKDHTFQELGFKACAIERAKRYRLGKYSSTNGTLRGLGSYAGHQLTSPRFSLCIHDMNASRFAENQRPNIHCFILLTTSHSAQVIELCFFPHRHRTTSFPSSGLQLAPLLSATGLQGSRASLHPLQTQFDPCTSCILCL